MNRLEHGGEDLGRIHRRANDKKFFCYFTGFLEGIVASGHIESGEVEPLILTCREFVERCRDADASDLFQDFTCDLLEIDTVEDVVSIRLQTIDPTCGKSSVNRFLGYCAGVACDGVIKLREAAGIVERALSLGENASRPGIIELLNTARDAVADDIISPEESAEVALAISKLVGDNYADTGLIGLESAVSIDEDIIANFPEDIEGAVFILTGEFEAKPRSCFEDRLLIAGMTAGRSVSRKVDYIIVGGKPSRDWLETNRGGKLIKGLELRRSTGRPFLVSEAQLSTLLHREGL